MFFFCSNTFERKMDRKKLRFTETGYSSPYQKMEWKSLSVEEYSLTYLWWQNDDEIK